MLEKKSNSLSFLFPREFFSPEIYCLLDGDSLILETICSRYSGKDLGFKYGGHCSQNHSILENPRSDGYLSVNSFCVPRAYVQDIISFFMASLEAGHHCCYNLISLGTKTCSASPAGTWWSSAGSRASYGDQHPAQESDGALPFGHQWTSKMTSGPLHDHPMPSSTPRQNL